MKFGSTDDFSFFNKVLSKYLFFKKCVSFQTSVFSKVLRKMNFGHENKNIKD